jgi:hypothetical protein
MIKVFIKPFDVSGNYKEFEDVTNYVDTTSISSIKRSIDSTEYDVGVIKLNNITMKLSNETGKFSDVDSIRSMFSYKRSDSIVKITWNPNDYDTQCGSIAAGNELLANDGGTTVFEGLLNDEATTQSISTQVIKFKILGYDSILKTLLVPYTSITNGDTIEEVILAICDQAPFNELITVSASNITVGSNVAIDDKSSMENKIALEQLNKLLLIGNAVLYIEDKIMYVSARQESATNQYTFYGQASNDGVENIESIESYRNGLNRVVNYWTWKDTPYFSSDTTSNDLYGYRNKEIEYDIITNGTSVQTILDNLKDEFAQPKIELDIKVKVKDDRLALKILDKVNIDYPTITFPGEGDVLPIYGVAVYGTDKYPFDEYSLTIDDTTFFKIIGISQDLKNERITYKLREV